MTLEDVGLKLNLLKFFWLISCNIQFVYTGLHVSVHVVRTRTVADALRAAAVLKLSKSFQQTCFKREIYKYIHKLKIKTKKKTVHKVG